MMCIVIIWTLHIGIEHAVQYLYPYCTLVCTAPTYVKRMPYPAGPIT